MFTAFADGISNAVAAGKISGSMAEFLSREGPQAQIDYCVSVNFLPNTPNIEEARTKVSDFVRTVHGVHVSTHGLGTFNVQTTPEGFVTRYQTTGDLILRYMLAPISTEMRNEFLDFCKASGINPDDHLKVTRSFEQYLALH